MLLTVTGALIGSVPTGFLPDSVILAPDGTKALAADEGQPSCVGTTLVEVPG